MCSLRILHLVLAMPRKSNLNNASYDQLLKIHNIGKTLAKRLTEHMPFKSWQDVEKVEGMGPARVSQLKMVFGIWHDCSGCETDDDGVGVSSNCKEQEVSNAELGETSEHSWRCVVS